MSTKPFYEHAGITIYHGDCREILPTLEPVDLVLSDPPYGISHESCHDATWEGTQIAGDRDVTIRDFAWDWFDDKPRAMFGISWMAPIPKNVRAVLIWDKEHSGCGDLTFPWKPSWEEIYVAGEGWEGSRGPGVLRGPCIVTWQNHPNGRQHPHQKPTWIFSHLMNKQPKANLILDPFMGSGTMLRAAKNLGRGAIGIEIEEKYCEIAAKRLSQEVFEFG